MSDKTGRLFFDISALLNYVRSADNYTGIQRVAVTIISEMSELVDPETLYVTWFDRKKKTHFCTPFSQIGRDAFASPTSIRQRFRLGRARRSSIPVLRPYRKRPVAYFLRRSWLDLQSVLGNDRRFRKYDMTAQMWRNARRRPTYANTHELKKHPLKDVHNQSDHLILLDSAWMPEHIAAFAAAKQRGMTVHSMVYDLIPILMPDVCSGSTPSAFFEWLLKSTEYTDQYIAISTSTGEDLKTFLGSHSTLCSVNDVALAQAPMPPIHKDNAFQTGAGPLEALVADTVYPKLKAALTQDDRFRRILASPFVLCVGTIEARKNVWRIALAWKALLDQGTYALPKLVFAGKWGWLHDDFKDFLQGTSNLYGYIQVIEGPSDAELEQLYGACLFTVMPSLYEGWGLPVGEALAYGKTAVIADNSSLPEVGGDLVEYCDAQSVESIVGALKLVLDPDHRALLEAKIAATDLRSWADVAKDLLIAIDPQDSMAET